MSTIIVGCDENMVCVQTYREFIITIKELQFSKILTRKQKILTNVWSPSWIDFQKTNVMTFVRLGHIGHRWRKKLMIIILVYIFKEKNVWMSIRQLIYVAWCRQYPFDIIDNNFLFLFFDYCHCHCLVIGWLNGLHTCHVLGTLVWWWTLWTLYQWSPRRF